MKALKRIIKVLLFIVAILAFHVWILVGGIILIVYGVGKYIVTGNMPAIDDMIFEPVEATINGLESW